MLSSLIRNFGFQPQITEPEGLTCRMNFVELCDATDYFSAENTIGVGKIGVTYKARLPNRCLMAVKRLYDSQLSGNQFDLEIMILGRYKHRNIVPLLGFCKEQVERKDLGFGKEENERKERILIYQYMPNGRLSDLLSMRNGHVALNWPVRVRIALGIARGLCWLHHNVHVVHFSICSECILLDQNFEPKISNFDGARFIHQNIGNDLDMSFHIENWSNNEIGYEKMDVYNFGIVLLELLEGKEINPMTDSFINNDNSVVTCIASLSESPSGFPEAIDKSLINKGYDDEIFILLKIACCCIQSFLDYRPTMLEVFNKMSYIWERHGLDEDFEMCKQSEIASSTTGGDEIVEIESL